MAMLSWMLLVCLLPGPPSEGTASRLDREKPVGEKPVGEKPVGEKPVGEDVDLSGDDPLIRIGRTMRAAGTRIGQGDTSAQTQQLQRRVVEDLDKLIRQVQKSQRSQSQRNPSSSAAQGLGGDGREPDSKPARDSTDRVGKGAPAATQRERFETLVKQVWGHLPPKLRESMLQQSAIDQFLPKYEELIEDYYRRLAEPRDGS